MPTGQIGPGTYIFQGHRLSGAFYAGALCATVPIGRAQSQPTVPHASVLCTVQVVHSKQSSDGRLPRSCGLITVDSDIAPSLLYHQCFAAPNHSALRSPSARLYGNLASAPCLLYEHKTFPPSLSLLRLSLSQDHNSERSEAQITGTHHRYPLSFLAYQKFHSPKRRCRPYYHTPFVENIRSFLMIWRLATLPDTAGLALWPKTWAAFRISHLRVGEPPTRPQTCDSGNSPDYCE